MLHIIATPIGNLDDMAPRALKALRDADVLACEDTRRTRILLNHFSVACPSRVLSYRQGNEERAGGELVAALREGKTVAFCTDGGYPGLSDPGYRLIRLAIEHDEAFDILPGPSAIHVALLLSGLPTSSYTFKGYPPRKPGALRRFFETESAMPHTLVVFESPFRVGNTLSAAVEALGDRQAAVCVELTKKFERVARGWLSSLAAQFLASRTKGEVTLVIAGNNPKFLRDSGIGAAHEDSDVAEQEETG